MKVFKLPFYLQLACVLVILVATGYIAILGKDLIVPLLFSFLFAILLLPLANFFENKSRMPRSVASLLAVIILLIGMFLIIYVMAAQVADLSKEWPQLKSQMERLMHNIQQWAEVKLHINIERQTEYIDNATSNLLNSSAAIIEKTVVSVSSILLFLVFILIYTILLLFYRRLLMRFIVASFNERHYGIIYEISEQVKRIIRKYITGLFFEMVIVAVITFIVFLILGIKNVFLLALLVGVLNVIPYIGIFTALILSMTITFATSDGAHALLAGVAIIVIHLLDSNLLMPKIVGSQVKINPLIVILGVILGEKFFGISGMFLSIPFIAIAKIIFDRVEGLQSWGILLGEEEHTPRRVKEKIVKIKKEEDS